MSELTGLVAVVTGGGSGIGLATTKLLLDRGADVGVLDLDPSAVPEQALGIKCDLTDETAVSAAVDAIAERFGHIDALVNNAAIAGTAGTIADGDLAEWAQVYDVNVYGAIRATRAVLPHLRRSANASIVNTCSVVNAIGLPDRAMYAASKGAMHALTLASAADLIGEGIRVNGIAPGTTDTPAIAGLMAATGNPDEGYQRLAARVPMGRLMRPEEIAAASAFLVSPLAAGITGIVIPVHGGLGVVAPR
ncbi:MAG TPA: SDR family NAD(P)-dependent oxidoreductase [Asanoa sp.]|nr:SDR family NAD(P)-dependent oxidoreductase [Asanoa sp.]